jgi:hypothetical protein
MTVSCFSAAFDSPSIVRCRGANLPATKQHVLPSHFLKLPSEIPFDDLTAYLLELLRNLLACFFVNVRKDGVLL